MKRQLVEAVPNFSEGRRPEVIAAIMAAVEGVRGIRVLNVHSDSDHNRSVVTLVGRPEPLLESLFRGTAAAAQLIDMREHRGVHPRIGATDVIPLIPVHNIDIEACIPLAVALGERVAAELDIPVYLYEHAARSPQRRCLADVRRGEFEGLLRESTEPGRRPDLGGPSLHPSAGATVIGVRGPLIAFNVNLRTDDPEVAREIARAVRASSGGLAYIRALGLELKDQGLVQVSMNVINHQRTPLHRAFELVKREAESRGVLVAGSELVGLVPLAALVQTAGYYLRLGNLHLTDVLETHLMEEFDC